MKKSMFRAVAAAVGILVLIFDSKAALIGAGEALDLCIRTLIPSLFPFFVLSSYLTGNLIGQPVGFLRPVCGLCGVPDGAESLFAVGILGGYPVGAQNIAAAWRSGTISKSDAERMLAFCSNAGPAFIFGILGPMFSNPIMPWLLWGVHVTSALLVGIILKERSAEAASLPCRNVTVSDALESSLKVMALVCGWVMLFRMILTFLERWLLWIFPEPLRVLAAGILELSNGLIQLERISSEGLRFIFACFLLSAGGLCVTMQTLSVVRGLSLRYYFTGKTMQCAFSLVIGYFVLRVFAPEQQTGISRPVMISIVLISVFFLLFQRIRKKRSSIPDAIGV